LPLPQDLLRSPSSWNRCQRHGWHALYRLHDARQNTQTGSFVNMSYAKKWFVSIEFATNASFKSKLKIEFVIWKRKGQMLFRKITMFSRFTSWACWCYMYHNKKQCCPFVSHNFRLYTTRSHPSTHGISITSRMAFDPGPLVPSTSKWSNWFFAFLEIHIPLMSLSQFWRQFGSFECHRELNLHWVLGQTHTITFCSSYFLNRPNQFLPNLTSNTMMFYFHWNVQGGLLLYPSLYNALIKTILLILYGSLQKSKEISAFKTSFNCGDIRRPETVSLSLPFLELAELSEPGDSFWIHSSRIDKVPYLMACDPLVHEAAQGYP
jgi:hypothetical protein